MNVENLFKIEDILKNHGDVYEHVAPFVGAVDVDTLLGGIIEEESDFRLKTYTGNVIIVWCTDGDDRFILWKKIYKSVECHGDEVVKVFFFHTLANEPIIVIPVDF